MMILIGTDILTEQKKMIQLQTLATFDVTK